LRLGFRLPEEPRLDGELRRLAFAHRHLAWNTLRTSNPRPRAAQLVDELRDNNVPERRRELLALVLCYKSFHEHIDCGLDRFMSIRDAQTVQEVALSDIRHRSRSFG